MFLTERILVTMLWSMIASILLTCIHASMDNREFPLKPACVEAQEHPFANCRKLRLAGECKSNRVKKWCPKTCKYCIETRAAAPVQCHLTTFGCCADGIKAAKGKNGLGCPENCKDYDKRNCKHYASQKFCEDKSYFAIMRRLCPESCFMCGKKIVDNCYNLVSDSYCKKLERMGFCRSKTMQGKMRKYCALTCEACGNNVPKLAEVMPKCAGVGCCWDDVTPINKGCPVCKNKGEGTFCQRFKSDCFHIDRLPSVQMKTICSETCGICDLRTCKDHHTYGVYCKDWKSSGECKKNPKGMRHFCRKTCGFCR